MFADLTSPYRSLLLFPLSFLRRGGTNKNETNRRSVVVSQMFIASAFGNSRTFIKISREEKYTHTHTHTCRCVFGDVPRISGLSQHASIHERTPFERREIRRSTFGAARFSISPPPSARTTVVFIRARARTDIHIARARASWHSSVTKESSGECLIVRWYLGSTRRERRSLTR